MRDAWRRPIIQPDELAVLQYTSGSTGRPKGVMLSHSNFLANCRMITEAFEASGDDISMTWLPTYHDMGLIGGVLEPVFVGTPVVMMSPMAFLQQPVRWLRCDHQARHHDLRRSKFCLRPLHEEGFGSGLGGARFEPLDTGV